MIEVNNAQVLREIIRVLERKLGMLDDIQSSCCGVTFSQCHAIVEIGRAGKLSLNDLAELLSLDKSTMSRTMNNLVNNDMAIREIDPAYRRYITIKLTPKGMKAFQEIEESMGVYFSQIYHSIPEAQREQVIESLQLLLQAMRGNDCC
jgi:DNA-binding MarR family transcriptional regulator